MFVCKAWNPVYYDKTNVNCLLQEFNMAPDVYLTYLKCEGFSTKLTNYHSSITQSREWLGYMLDETEGNWDWIYDRGARHFWKASTPVLGPIRLPSQWVLGPLSQEVQRPWCEPNNPPPSSAEINNARSYLHSSIRLHDVVPSSLLGFD
jgi:hypothetical protein